MSLTMKFHKAFLAAGLMGCALLMGCGGKPVVAPDAPRVTVPRSQQFELKSKEGLTYRIFVAEPKEEAPPEGYATFFVLDANAMFLTAVDQSRFQKGLTPALVVGIGYPIDGTVDQVRRYHDFTPVTPFELIRQSTSGPPVQAESTGGQEEFLNFIQHTLKPTLAARYKINADQSAVFGHSLAGRWVLWAMFTQPTAFKSYIAASPSIWWNNRSLLTEAAAFTTKPSPVNALITVGEFEQKYPPGTKPERIEFFNFAKMVDSARELSADLQKQADKGVKVTFIEMKDENHGTVVPPSISRGLRFALMPTTKPAK